MNGSQSFKKCQVRLLYAAYIKKIRNMNSGPGITLYIMQKIVRAPTYVADKSSEKNRDDCPANFSVIAVFFSCLFTMQAGAPFH
jgi:hypothetical protein